MAAAAVAAGVVLATSPPTPEGFTIHFLDVGQGDAILITTDGGATLLVDGGRSKPLIRDRLKRLEVDDLDAVLVTHADTDHFAGLVAVLEDFNSIKRVYVSGAQDGVMFDNFMMLVRDKRVVISEIGRGDDFKLGALKIQVLHPARLTDNPSADEKNAESIVLLVQCGSVNVLLTGDAQKSSEVSMIEAEVLADIDVLKVGHHGSKTSTSPEFLKVIRPKYAVISAGLDHPLEHPDDETLKNLDEVGDANFKVFLTDTTKDADGITLTTDCNEVVTVECTHPPAPKPTRSLISACIENPRLPTSGLRAP